ncbi:SEFIR domain-containing protein [Aliamphritea hakodatensis]|uniref:SEFIR domain-containing protein n=1 Tax=Aliamphritea hakodatensis TaxID=2895352 RepID=UPI0022FD8A3F|nr:SEFIR domain-containing protein [Aliamphritea hakodatensis]
MDSQKLFISYSWSNAEHEEWVLNLATELRESGVDVILDKWDLKEGHDAYAFMEKMVTDATISKVIIVSDEVYARKSDARHGGVGTESQIISKEIYDNQEQNKFVVVVAERDEENTPCLPVYYKSRLYIDLSDSSSYPENFEKLLRWIYNKPVHLKPELGRKPAYLDEGETISLGTTALFKRLIHSIKEGKGNPTANLAEYLNAFVSSLSKFKIEYKNEEIKDDIITKNIELFLPHRNELISVIKAVSLYDPSERNISLINNFFEQSLKYYCAIDDSPRTNWDFDNYKFIIHELFLYYITILIKDERFQEVNFTLSKYLYIPKNWHYSPDHTIQDFTIIREYIKSISYRNERLELRKISLRADMLKQRTTSPGIDFEDLMQTDFVLFIRAKATYITNNSKWWPETLLYADYHYRAFEIFSRAVSTEYFNKMKIILQINSPTEISEFINSSRENRNFLPSWEGQSIDVARLSALERLSTLR